MAKRRVFVDANTIIGAFGVFGGQSHCWRAICRHFSVETAARCVTETQRGSPARAGYIPVPSVELDLIGKHKVAEEDLATFRDQGGLPILGAGEMHLLTWLHFEESAPPSAPGGPRKLPADLRIATVDRMALRALHRLGWLQDHVVSLEWLAGQAGVDFPAPEQIPEKHAHQTETWLQRQKLLLG